MTDFSLLLGINLLAVLVAGIANMAIDVLWFNSRVFGNTWKKITGGSLNPAPKWLVVGFFGHLIIALVLAVIVVFANARTVLEGIAVGALVWIGFVVTLEIGELIWERIPYTLFGIRIGGHLISLSVAGAILAVWR